MKKSQLVQIVKEAMKGYHTDPETGETETTDGGSTSTFRTILTKMATRGSEQEPQDVQEDADKTRAEHLGTLRGSLMHVIALLNAERPYEEIIAHVKKALEQVSSSDTVASRGRMAEGEGEQTYLVYYRVGEDDDDDVEVKASSPEEAIEKAKAGKTAGGQNMPRLARSFSAKLMNK